MLQPLGRTADGEPLFSATQVRQIVSVLDDLHRSAWRDSAIRAFTDANAFSRVPAYKRKTWNEAAEWARHIAVCPKCKLIRSFEASLKWKTE